MPEQPKPAGTCEHEAVIALSAPTLGAVERKLNSMSTDSLNWQRFLELAKQWQLEAIVFRNLVTQKTISLPPDVKTAAVTGQRDARAIALARTIAAGEVVSAFRGKGVIPILLKGASVAVAAYGDPSLRMSADIDLLIRPHEVLTARKIAGDLGFQPTYARASERDLIARGHALELLGSTGKLELHGCLVSHHLRFNIPTDEIWNCAASFQAAGYAFDGLSLPHLFVFLCAHGAKHEWAELKWICDVAHLANRVSSGDAKMILDVALRTNSRRLLALGLRVAHDLLDADISAFSSSPLGTHAVLDRLTSIVRAGFIPGPSRSAILRSDFLSRRDPRFGPLVFWMRSRERLWDRLRVVSTLLYYSARSHVA
jgi:hypothetical protein